MSEDQDGILPIEQKIAMAMFKKWEDPKNPAVLIHEDPRTVARFLRPYLATVWAEGHKAGDRWDHDYPIINPYLEGP